MNNYSIDSKPLELKCIIKAKKRFSFVISYFIGSVSLVAAAVILIIVVITDFKLSFMLIIPLLVFTGFVLLFLFLSNKIVYYIKGKEVFCVKGDVFYIYRKGYFKFHKEQFHREKLIEFGLVSKKKSVLFDESYEGDGGKVYLSFRNIPKSIWGNITKDFQFGASLSDSDAEDIILAFRKFLDS